MTENLFEFNGSNYVQTHGVALGIKTVVSFANIYKAESETNLIQHRNTNGNVSLVTFPFFGTVTEKTQLFIKETKTNPIPKIKSTAKIWNNEINFLDTIVSKENISQRNPSSLDIKSHYKPTKTFQHVHFTSFHPSGVKRSFIKGKEIRLIRKSSRKKTNIWRVPCELKVHEYPIPDIERSLLGCQPWLETLMGTKTKTKKYRETIAFRHNI